ncbi:hypothetical protein NHX12_027104 [Muraenolepis orangiensis]|uniref:Uncharacterized protein n=1 Tax=Muraenolepis orangiensis TaxID=630683 RepID=A0A9Q0EEB3_9TELE|nr:hypothetical protein NHX12_027104 [Muraenolepis orangiensis]
MKNRRLAEDLNVLYCRFEGAMVTPLHRSNSHLALTTGQRLQLGVQHDRSRNYSTPSSQCRPPPVKSITSFLTDGKQPVSLGKLTSLSLSSQVCHKAACSPHCSSPCSPTTAPLGTSLLNS